MRSTEIVTEFLGKVSYPITKTKLVEAAHNFRMDGEMVQAVESLPNKTFGSLEEVIPYLTGGIGALGAGGISEKVGNVIGRASDKLGVGGGGGEKAAAEHDHWEQDALARGRRKTSQAEGEREAEDTLPPYHISDHAGRSQST